MVRYRDRVSRPLTPITGPDGRPNLFRLKNSDGILFYKAQRAEHKSNPSSRFITPELEIANISLPSERHPTRDTRFLQQLVGKAGWSPQVVSDISLPSPMGFEINMSPASGDLFIRQTEDICGVLASYKASVVNTTDPSKWVRPCGCHVHVDARDYTYNDLRRFLFVYEKLEPLLFGMLPGYRRKSHFCVPCGNVYAEGLREYKAFIVKRRAAGEKDALAMKGSDIARHAIIQKAYGTRQASRGDKRACPISTRYRSLNLHAYFYRGTLEFRHLHGTLDPWEITNWGMLLAGMMDYAFRAKEIEIKKLCDAEPDKALEMACLTPEVWEFCEKQRDRFSVPQQIKESPRLGEILHEERPFYFKSDVLPIIDRQARQRAEEGRPEIPGRVTYTSDLSFIEERLRERLARHE